MFEFIVFALLFFILQLPLEQLTRTIVASVGVVVFAILLLTTGFHVLK